MLDNRVMTRGDVIAAERCRFTPEIAELELFIAHHARIRRPTGLVLAGEIFNHEPLELVGFVDNIMRNAQRMRHAARICYCLGTATFVLRTGDTVLRPDFHSDADHVVALFAQKISGDAGVHSTAHSKKNALLLSVHSNAKVNVEKRPSNCRWVARASRALVSASRRNNLSFEFRLQGEKSAQKTVRDR